DCRPGAPRSVARHDRGQLRQAERARQQLRRGAGWLQLPPHRDASGTWPGPAREARGEQCQAPIAGGGLPSPAGLGGRRRDAVRGTRRRLLVPHPASGVAAWGGSGRSTGIDEGVRHSNQHPLPADPPVHQLPRPLRRRRAERRTRCRPVADAATASAHGRWRRHAGVRCPGAGAMNILVTGGAGYFGSTLVPLLLAGGHSVRVLDWLAHGGRPLLGVWSDPRFSFVRADIRDTSAVQAALDGMQAVVHLAAIVGDPACARQPELARAVNQDAATSLLETSRALGVERFVFASTCSNYGRMADPEQLVDETAPLQPLSVYAETKVSVERAVLDGAAAGVTCTTALRFATLFGVSR